MKIEDLGEVQEIIAKRADLVAKAMAILGVGTLNISSVSYSAPVELRVSHYDRDLALVALYDRIWTVLKSFYVERLAVLDAELVALGVAVEPSMVALLKLSNDDAGDREADA